MPRWLKRLLHRLWLPEPHRLWRRYAVALVLVLTVVTVSHLAAIGVLRSGAHYNELIAVSERQGMLSQRIMYFVHEHTLNDDSGSEQRLKSALRLFEDSHAWIIEHPALSEAVSAHYFDRGDIPLDPFSRRFAALARTYLQSEGAEKRNIRNQIAAWGEEQLLTSLNEAVRLIEADAKAHEAQLLQVKQITFGIAVLVLLLEAIAIFLPAQVSVSRAFSRQKRRSTQLAASLRLLKARSSELRSVRHDLDRAEQHDALTGLMNRQSLLKTIDGRLEQQADDGGLIGLIKFDLDHFHVVNDRSGQLAGDAVLAASALRLADGLSDNQTLARLGGDEFILLVHNPASVSDLLHLAHERVERMRDAVSTEHGRFHITISAGVSITDARDATRDQLLVEADLALFEAKRHGRACARLYSRELGLQISRRRAFVAEIEQALENDQFVAFLQPQVDVGNGSLHGAEALARWRHPDQGMIVPAGFLEAARAAGLLPRIDMLIVNKALDALVSLRKQGVPLPHVAVNACAETLRDAEFPANLDAALKTRGLTADDLVVEVLESTLIDGENDTILKTVEKLTHAGISVFLDDFGTGYATMATLTHLSLSGIKIDRSLIDPLPQARAQSIVSALIALSRNLHMKVAAEGVEAPRHFAAVNSLGCDIMQGFGIGRPMSERDFLFWHRAFELAEPQAASG